MGAFIQRNKFILTMLALVVCLSCAAGITMKFDPATHAANANTSSPDYSWSTFAEAAAQYLNMTASPEGNHGAGVALPGGNNSWASGFLGYMTPGEDSKYVIGALQSNNTVQYSYSALKSISNYHLPAGWSQSALMYAGYGYGLEAMGVDEPVILGQVSNSHRDLIGPVILIVFLLCMVLPEFFKFVLTILSYANPFKLFLGSNSVIHAIVPNAGDGTSQQFTNIYGGAIGGAISTALNNLANTITGLYNVLYHLSFAVVIPIMIAVALFMWLIVNNGRNAGHAFKNLAIRVIFVGLGVPLMLACYSAAIDSVKDFTIGNATGTPEGVILSTFCDFGGWAIPSYDGSSDIYGSEWGDVGKALQLGDASITVDQGDTQKYSIKGASTSTPRKLVATINYMQGGAYKTGLNTAQFGTIFSGSNNNKAITLANEDTGFVKDSRTAGNSYDVSSIIELLQRYTRGETITAADWAMRYGQIIALPADSYMLAGNMSDNWSNFDPNKAVAYKYANEDSAAAVGSLNITDAEAKAYAAGRLTGSGPASIIANIYKPTHMENTNLAAGGTFTGTGRPFTPMGMYNYLSSTFSDSSITVYSTDATATNQVQIARYAVTVAGTGYLELAYIFDAIAIMSCLMVLGYGYAFALLFGCLKTIIMMFPKVLTGMIGSLKGIAGSLALVAALIIEIIGTCIMYAIGSLFIGSIYQLIEGPLATVLDSIMSLPKDASSLITVVASAVIIMTITKKLLDYRVAVVRATTETATSFINKFIGTNVVAPNLESNITPASAASIGLGLAMAGTSMPGGASRLADGVSNITDKATEKSNSNAATGALAGETNRGKFGEKLPVGTSVSSADSGSSGTASDSGGHYSHGSATAASDSGLSGSSGTTSEDEAEDYIDQNGKDFENQIGYKGDGSAEDSKAKAGIADHSSDLKDASSNGIPSLAGKKTYADGSYDELDENGKVTSYNADGSLKRKVPVAGEAGTEGSASSVSGNTVDNSQSVLTGTKEVDVSGKSAGSQSDSTSGAGSQANKMVMTDAAGNQSEVSLVNAKTGQAYTQADKNAGANYDVVGSDGKSIYGSGLSGGMSANTLMMDNGVAKGMVQPGSTASGGLSAYGGGNLVTLSQPAAPAASAGAVASAAAASQTVNSSVVNNTTQNVISQPAAATGGQTIVTGGQSGSANMGPVTVNANVGSTVVQQGSGYSGSSAPSNVNVISNVHTDGGSGNYSGGGETVNQFFNQPAANNNAGSGTVINNSTYQTSNMSTENVTNNTMNSSNLSENASGGKASGLMSDFADSAKKALSNNRV